MKRRIILLINPWIYDFAAYDFWNIPIGLLSLASLLRMNGADVIFLDCLDPYHPGMSAEGSLIRMPKRKTSGEGTYAKARIPKPDPLNLITGVIPYQNHRGKLIPASPVM